VGTPLYAAPEILFPEIYPADLLAPSSQLTASTHGRGSGSEADADGLRQHSREFALGAPSPSAEASPPTSTPASPAAAGVARDRGHAPPSRGYRRYSEAGAAQAAAAAGALPGAARGPAGSRLRPSIAAVDIGDAASAAAAASAVIDPRTGLVVIHRRRIDDGAGAAASVGPGSAGGLLAGLLPFGLSAPARQGRRASLAALPSTSGASLSGDGGSGFFESAALAAAGGSVTLGGTHWAGPTAAAILSGPRYAEYDNSAADVWSLGVILFRLLTGAFPFPAATMGQLKRGVMTGALPLPQPHVSPAAEALIRWMLQLDPFRRPTATEVCQHPFCRGVPLSTFSVLLPPSLAASASPSSAALAARSHSRAQHAPIPLSPNSAQLERLMEIAAGAAPGDGFGAPRALLDLVRGDTSSGSTRSNRSGAGGAAETRGGAGGRPGDEPGFAPAAGELVRVPAAPTALAPRSRTGLRRRLSVQQAPSELLDGDSAGWAGAALQLSPVNAAVVAAAAQPRRPVTSVAGLRGPSGRMDPADTSGHSRDSHLGAAPGTVGGLSLGDGSTSSGLLRGLDSEPSGGDSGSVSDVSDRRGNFFGDLPLPLRHSPGPEDGGAPDLFDAEQPAPSLQHGTGTGPSGAASASRLSRRSSLREETALHLPAVGHAPAQAAAAGAVPASAAAAQRHDGGGHGEEGEAASRTRLQRRSGVGLEAGPSRRGSCPDTTHTRSFAGAPDAGAAPPGSAGVLLRAQSRPGASDVSSGQPLQPHLRPLSAAAPPAPVTPETGSSGAAAMPMRGHRIDGAAWGGAGGNGAPKASPAASEGAVASGGPHARRQPLRSRSPAAERAAVSRGSGASRGSPCSSPVEGRSLFDGPTGSARGTHPLPTAELQMHSAAFATPRLQPIVDASATGGLGSGGAPSATERSPPSRAVGAGVAVSTHRSSGSLADTGAALLHAPLGVLTECSPSASPHGCLSRGVKPSGELSSERSLQGLRRLSALPALSGQASSRTEGAMSAPEGHRPTPVVHEMSEGGRSDPESPWVAGGSIGVEGRSRTGLGAQMLGAAVSSVPLSGAGTVWVGAAPGASFGSTLSSAGRGGPGTRASTAGGLSAAAGTARPRRASISDQTRHAVESLLQETSAAAAAATGALQASSVGAGDGEQTPCRSESEGAAYPGRSSALGSASEASLPSLLPPSSATGGPRAGAASGRITRQRSAFLAGDGEGPGPPSGLGLEGGGSRLGGPQFPPHALRGDEELPRQSGVQALRTGVRRASIGATPYR